MKDKAKSLRDFAASREAKMEASAPALTPKLRFPEFRGAEGWRQTKIKDLCERSMDGTQLSRLRLNRGSHAKTLSSEEEAGGVL